ncbi:MAG: hypothetical protein KDD66_12595 [Bdellovibrionales bacterium]|nr:hypothetical protein [Bdellovibrionales bacterium]
MHASRSNINWVAAFALIGLLSLAALLVGPAKTYNAFNWSEDHAETAATPKKLTPARQAPRVENHRPVKTLKRLEKRLQDL